MCLLILQREGATVPTHQLVESWRSNPDGGGFAYIDMETNRVETRKYMHMNEFIDSYEEHVIAHPKSPFLIHFRWATHGSTDLYNVHPFRISDQTVVGHNGVINLIMSDDKDDKRSDTRTFVEDYIPRLGEHWADDIYLTDMVEDFVSGSKLVMLNANPEYADLQWYIFNEHSGHWSKDKQVWYSNYSYVAVSKPKKPKKSKSGSKSTASYGYGIYSQDWAQSDRDDMSKDDGSILTDPKIGDGDFVEWAEGICGWCGSVCHDADEVVCFECDWCHLCEDGIDECIHMEAASAVSDYVKFLERKEIEKTFRDMDPIAVGPADPDDTDTVDVDELDVETCGSVCASVDDTDEVAEVTDIGVWPPSLDKPAPNIPADATMSRVASRLREFLPI